MGFGRLFRLMHLRQVVRQPLRTTLAVVAIGAGVAIVVGSGLLVHSLSASIEEVLAQLGGPAPLRVVGPLSRAGLDERVVPAVAGTPGVAEVVPGINAVTVAEGTKGRETIIAIGVDCRIEAIVGTFGCDPTAFRPAQPGAPVLVSPALKAALGSDAVIRTDVGRVRIGDIATNDSLAGANGGNVAVFTLRDAQRLFEREGRLDALYVQIEHGVDPATVKGRIEQRIGRWNTVLLRGETPPWSSGASPLVPLLGVAGLFGLGLSSLLVYNIASLSLAERRRDFAVVSAVGARPVAITLNVVVEAAVLGLVGGIVGGLGGILLAKTLVDSVADVIMTQGTGIHVQTYVSGAVLVWGLLVGTITAALAAVIPALRARNLDLAAELHGRGVVVESVSVRSVRRFSILVGCGVLAVALSSFAARNGGLAPWQPSLGGLALVVAAASMFAAAGAAAPLLLRVVLRLVRRRGGPVRVAVANLVAQPRRTGVTATAVASAVGLACVLGSAIPAIRAAAREGLGASADDRLYASVLPINNAATVDATLSPSVMRSLSRLPGVERVDRQLYVGVGDERGELGLFADEHPVVGTYQPILGDVTTDALARGEIIVGTGAARAFHLRPGSSLEIPTPTGFANLKVAGIWAAPNNNGYSIEISVPRLEALYGKRPPRAILVKPARDTTPDQLAETIKRAHLDPNLYVLTQDEIVERLTDEIGEQVTPFWALQRVLLLAALIGTLSTLLLVGVQRRRELGVLGAVGFGPFALGRITLSEGVAAAAAGAVVGALGSVVAFEALRNVAALTIGAKPPFAADPGAAVVSTALALATVAVGCVLPAWRTSRVNIVEAIRDE